MAHYWPYLSVVIKMYEDVPPPHNTAPQLIFQPPPCLCLVLPTARLPPPPQPLSPLSLTIILPGGMRTLHASLFLPGLLSVIFQGSSPHLYSNPDPVWRHHKTCSGVWQSAKVSTWRQNVPIQIWLSFFIRTITWTEGQSSTKETSCYGTRWFGTLAFMRVLR